MIPQEQVQVLLVFMYQICLQKLPKKAKVLLVLDQNMMLLEVDMDVERLLMAAAAVMVTTPVVVVALMEIMVMFGLMVQELCVQHVLALLLGL